MGRSVVDATKACRMRRTRGDMGRCRRVAAECVVVLLPAALPGVVDDFVASGLCGVGFAAG